jgi:hypothetical protein
MARGNNAKLLNRKIGLGDILFILACCFVFSPFNFLFFYCCSLLFSLMMHLVFVKGLLKRSSYTVPLAGWMAVFLQVYVMTLQILKYSIITDDWILQYLF